MTDKAMSAAHAVPGVRGGGLLEVIDGGLGNSIQDGGRPGYRHLGVTLSGWLDAPLARCANVLAGNDSAQADTCACIEIRGVGPTLMVRQGSLRVALAGAVGAELCRAPSTPEGVGTQQSIGAWRSLTLSVGDVLEVGAVDGGTAYLAVSGGIDVTPQLGSRATYQRALLGGVDGNWLKAGDSLPCTALPPGARSRMTQQQECRAEPWQAEKGPLRVMLGPQDDHFTAVARQVFVASEFRVTPQLDRMGILIDGPIIAHIDPACADIVSDAVTAGAIQVPSDGHPIILLADCQTVGGHPKIATVIAADLPRLGQLKPGDTLRFTTVGARVARAALQAREQRWAAWRDSVVCGLPEAGTLAADTGGGWAGDEN